MYKIYVLENGQWELAWHANCSKGAAYSMFNQFKSDYAAKLVKNNKTVKESLSDEFHSRVQGIMAELKESLTEACR